MVAFMGISAECILWSLCMLSGGMLILSLGKALEELRLCNQGWSTVIGCGIWVFVFMGLLALFPHKRPSDNLSLLYPYITLIVFLLPYASGGIALLAVMVFGFILSIFRKRREYLKKKLY